MPYSKFVIISHLRSGTHMLRTLLESHPALVCQTEVFNSDDPALPFPLATPGKDILEQWVYRDFDPAIKSVGFVLQAYHPWGLKAFPGIRENPSWGDIWDLLEAMPGLRVIHLWRENLLRRHLSHVMARQTGTWHNWDPGRVAAITHLHTPQAGAVIPGDRPRVILDPDLLRVDFEEVEQLHRAVVRRFGSGQYLALSYEQLCRDSEGQGARLLEFLELPAQPLAAAVSRLENRPLPDSIQNFPALRALFADTRWAGFFDC